MDARDWWQLFETATNEMELCDAVSTHGTFHQVHLILRRLGTRGCHLC
jgi:hypothetical protein